MMNPRPKSFAASATIFAVIGSVILFLSGLCTLMFAFASGSDEYTGGPLGALMIGSMGMVPSALLAFAGWRAFKKGPNKISAVIIGLMAIGILIWNIALAVDIARQTWNSNTGIWIFIAMFSCVGLAMLYWAVSVFRATRDIDNPF